VRADRIVFSIKGNSYRRVAAVDFEKGIVWIKWIGTHRDYADDTEIAREAGDLRRRFDSSNAPTRGLATYRRFPHVSQ
jgi:hypothetical protein